MRHLAEIDGFTMFVESAGSTVALIVTKAIFNADDDPLETQLVSCTTKTAEVHG